MHADYFNDVHHDGRIFFNIPLDFCYDAKSTVLYNLVECTLDGDMGTLLDLILSR